MSGNQPLAVAAAKEWESGSVYHMLLHDDLYAEDLIVSVFPHSEKTGQLCYKLSPLATCYLFGGVTILDEVSRLRPRSASSLCSALDETGVLTSILGGFSIARHPGFRLICTSNHTDFSTGALPQYLLDRLPIRLDIKNPSVERLNQIVNKHCAFNGQEEEFLSIFWKNWRKQFKNIMPTPRKIIAVAKFAFSLAGIRDITINDFIIAEAVNAIKFEK